MDSHSAAEVSASENAVNSCRKLAKHLSAGRATFEEYTYNLMLNMVSVLEDDLPRCIETVPPGLLALYMNFLRAELEPVDFMPFPGAFLVNSNSEEEIESQKRKYRPKYIRLYELMKEKARSLEEPKP